MKIAFILDDILRLNIVTDTSLFLAHEANVRGYQVYYINRNDLFFNKKLYAKACKIKINYDLPNIILEDEVNILLEDFSIIWMRHDPPFDISYLNVTYLLDHLPKTVKIYNDPKLVRDYPEKLLVNIFPEFLPDTLISSDIKEIKNFQEKHKSIILKPLYSYGGKDVFYIDEKGNNLNVVFSILQEKYQTSMVAQKYIEEVKQGDIRVLIIDGKVEGVFGRSAHNDHRTNLAVGGKAYSLDLTAQQSIIAQKVASKCRELGIFFAGIDLIADYLIEVNVTCPTGIVTYNDLTEINLAKTIWDKITYISNEL